MIVHYAPLAESADALDLGSSSSEYGFKSREEYHRQNESDAIWHCCRRHPYVGCKLVKSKSEFIPVKN